MIGGFSVVFSINSSGVISPDSYTGVDKTATLTATLTSGEVTSTKDFSVTVLKLPLTDTQRVAFDKDALDLGDTSNINSSLTLPTTGSQGSTITWSSSDISVVSNTGVVTQPTYSIGSKRVTLIVTISKGSVSETKSFFVTVSALDISDDEASILDSNEVGNLFSQKTFISDLNIPTIGTYGSTITFLSSSDTSVIDLTGKVTRPSYIDGDKRITLKFTFLKGDERVIKLELDVFVTKLAMTDAEAVAIAQLNLSLGDTTNVTENLTLPSTGLHGTSITYSSSDSSVVSDGGVVVRPEFGSGDTTVILTATISKNGVSELKEFTIVIKKLDAITADLPNVALYSNATTSIVRTYGNYIFEVRTNSSAPTDATKLTIILFGKTSVTGLEDSETITFALHGEYASGTNFQLIIKNNNSDIVAKSEVVNFTTGMIDIGFGTVQVP